MVFGVPPTTGLIFKNIAFNCMKLNLFFILLIAASVVNAQTIVTVYAADNNKPLANVLIYHKAVVIGETDKTGKVALQLNNIDSLVFVKNDYEDLLFAKDKLPEKVSMIKNQVIILNEVVITPITAEVLLKKITNFIDGKDENTDKKTPIEL